MLNNPNSNITFIRGFYSTPELSFKTDKALYLYSNSCEVPIIIVRVLVFFHTRLNLSQGLSTYKRDSEKHLIDFPYRRKPEV